MRALLIVLPVLTLLGPMASAGGRARMPDLTSYVWEIGRQFLGICSIEQNGQPLTREIFISFGKKVGPRNLYHFALVFRTAPSARPGTPFAISLQREDEDDPTVYLDTNLDGFVDKVGRPGQHGIGGGPCDDVWKVVWGR